MIYTEHVKRVFDFLLSSMALVTLGPSILIFLIIVGSITVKGNSFFT